MSLWLICGKKFLYQLRIYNVIRRDVFTAVGFHIVVLLLVNPCSLFGKFQRFGGMFYMRSAIKSQQMHRLSCNLPT